MCVIFDTVVLIEFSYMSKIIYITFLWLNLWLITWMTDEDLVSFLAEVYSWFFWSYLPLIGKGFDFALPFFGKGLIFALPLFG